MSPSEQATRGLGQLVDGRRRGGGPRAPARARSGVAGDDELELGGNGVHVHISALRRVLEPRRASSPAWPSKALPFLVYD
jgi:hypothetical protein